MNSLYQPIPWFFLDAYAILQAVYWQSSIDKQEIILWTPLKQILLDNLHHIQNN